MAIKNYTTIVPASRSVSEIQDALVKHGALGVSYQYEGPDRIKSVMFALPIGEKVGNFALPVEWRRFQQVLKNQNVSRADDDDYAYRVAWRCIRDWVLAQLALYETNVVELPQVFLPFAVDGAGRTLYDKAVTSGLLLGDGA